MLMLLLLPLGLEYSLIPLCSDTYGLAFPLMKMCPPEKVTALPLNVGLDDTVPVIVAPLIVGDVRVLFVKVSVPAKLTKSASERALLN